MRSLVFVTLGSFAAVSCLTAQALSEHAAAAAGATIGTAAGKPLGTALGKIFGDMNKQTSTAAGVKAKKPVEPKVVKAKPEETAPSRSASLAGAPSGGSFGAGGGGGSAAAPAHHGARRHETPEAFEPVAVPATPIVPVVSEPVVRQPTIDEVAAVKVGASSHDLETALGAPESRVSIPDDDGHLIEINQYWANGQPLGTIRLDNGRVVSVQARGY